MTTTTTLKTLIVDDEPELRESLKHILPTSFPQINFKFSEAVDGQDAIDSIKSNHYDLVLMDVKMPRVDGITALKTIKAHDPRTFVVIMTAHGNYSDAVEAIKEGAFDYFQKPVQKEQLFKAIDSCLKARELVLELTASNPIFDDDIDTEFVGNSHQMREVFHIIYKLAKVDTTVLIRGENGTGKELVARAIHHNSLQKNGQFVAVNCGAIPESLIESEFFGHEKGAFTGATERKIGKFQAANNGTLFLDEIGELKPDIQVKLLRAIQDKAFTPVGSVREVKTNVRIIAATNRNLEKMIQEGKFREDLFYRLNVMPIFMPPLRERLDDLDKLTDYFIKKFNKKQNRHFESIEPITLSLLKKYKWPGNIRELENFVERAFIVESGSKITNASLTEGMRTLLPTSTVSFLANQNTLPSGPHTEDTFKPLDFDIFKEEMEKDFIIKALKQNKGRINQTVANANIPKNTLLRKMRKYGINVKDLVEEK
ncbi:MAG: sigma-54-dependent Fis family transcriptional regulator [Bdellovibrionaceae bacterium]|nr:sigma-54-dependent Fis family transcriptional regulator [Pseudobdellovibrionaceae bacterium]